MGKLQIISPRDGDYLNRHDGNLTSDKLLVTVNGTCGPGAEVTVNGQPAQVVFDTFTADVPLSQASETIVAESDGESASITVMADLKSRKRYRYSIDDNIEFLHDLGTEPDSFGSLFDHWYLKFWKLMNDKYGMKVHINTYYELSDGSWNTSMMPDKWRDEWEANSNWLHLSFHARQNLPDRIYKAATYDQIAQDYDLVVGQIKRYAGDAVLTSETTVHWAEAPLEACRALKDRGIDTLIGLFWVKNGCCNTKYYLDIPQAEYCNTRDAWTDTKTGITFVTCDQVVNSWAADQVVPQLEPQVANPHTGEMIELLIHEQYFRQDRLPIGGGKRNNYFQSDVFEKVEKSIKWLTQQGYEPCFWSEGLLGSV